MLSRLVLNPFLAIILFLIASFGGCSDKNIPTTNEDSHKLIVAMDLREPPLQSLARNGHPYGMYVELVYELAEYLDKMVVIVNVKWQGSLSGINGEQYDLIPAVNIQKKYKKMVDFSIPYMQMGMNFITKKGLLYTNFKSLNHYKTRVAVQQGTISEKIVFKHLPKAKKIRFNNSESAFKAVLKGIADLSLHSPIKVYEYEKKYPNKIIACYQSLNPIPIGFALRKTKNKVLLKKVNTFIHQYKSSGKMQLLVDKYLGEIQKEYENHGEKFSFIL